MYRRRGIDLLFNQNEDRFGLLVINVGDALLVPRVNGREQVVRGRQIARMGQEHSIHEGLVVGAADTPCGLKGANKRARRRIMGGVNVATGIDTILPRQ